MPRSGLGWQQSVVTHRVGLVEEPIEHVAKIGAVLLDIGSERRHLLDQRPNVRARSPTAHFLPAAHRK
jgi:hypothetical protein